VSLGANNFKAVKAPLRTKPGFCPERGQGRVVQTMYTHVSKCKNNKKETYILVLFVEMLW
jgi:hypothetical protein